MIDRIGVLGAGAWGTALAAMLATRRGTVTLWGRNEKSVAAINDNKENPDYLPGISLPRALTATANLQGACAADAVLFVTPAQSFAKMADEAATMIASHAPVVLCSKGIDRQSGRFLHQIAADKFGKDRVFALSGPSFAHDVARGLPTAVVLAGSDASRADALAPHLSAPTFRVYSSGDIAGVEAGGALKNVLALAVGVARGLNLGASAEAALIARGFAEMSRLARAFGAQGETLTGLSGLGDLVLTCSSPQSRNFAYGMAMGRSEDLSARPLAEGVHTVPMAVKLAGDHGIDVPIMAMVHALTQGRIGPTEAVTALLSRPLKQE